VRPKRVSSAALRHPIDHSLLNVGPEVTWIGWEEVTVRRRDCHVVSSLKKPSTRINQDADVVREVKMGSSGNFGMSRRRPLKPLTLP